jgi:glycosyltransferase involved in cell wall biosynthesis
LIKKIKILHLTHTDLRYDNRILKELESLAETKKYIITAIGVKLDEDAAYADRQIDANISNVKLVTDIFSFMPRPITYSFRLIEMTIRFLLFSIKVKPNVIHCHDTMVLPVGVFIKFIFKSKLIYDAHELESNKNGQSVTLSKATLLIEKRYWRNIDHLISVSDSILNWYDSHLGRKKSTLILNSPIFEKSKKSSTPNRYFHELYKINEDVLVFVYLGYLGKGRSIEYILNIFANANISSHVVFIGYGELSSLILEYQQRTTNIHLHKSIPHDTIVDVVKSADVGFCLIENISLSDYYCLPNKLFEYIFAGVPVIASDFPDITNIVNKYQLGKTCKLEEASIYEAVQEIESNPPGRLTSDIEDLSWDAQSKKLQLLYDSIF